MGVRAIMVPSSGRDLIPPARLHDGLIRFLVEQVSFPPEVEVSSPEWHGEGRFYAAFSFGLRGAGPRDGAYIVRVLKPGDDESEASGRLARSAELLRLLDGACGLAPRCLGYDARGQYIDHPFTVESHVPGRSLSWEFGSVTRWAAYAGITLSRLHSLPLTPEITALFPAAEDFAIEMLRRAEGRANRLDRRPLPIVAGLEKAQKLLPSGSDPVLLHGDPQLQNLFFPDVGGDCTWIDWEFSRTGEREYDLAVFTRGDQVVDDLMRTTIRPILVQMYCSWFKTLIVEEHILFYEILLNVGMACTALERNESAKAEHLLHKLSRLSAPTTDR